MKRIILLLCILVNSNLYSQDFTFRSSQYTRKQELFDSLPVVKNSIVLLGNSITELFNVEFLQNPKVINRGIGSDQTIGVLMRLWSITKHKPKKIFIEIGVNDIAQRVPLDTMIINYKKIIHAIKMDSKKTKIYIESILPVANSGMIKYCNPKFNELIWVANESLKKLALEKQCVFVDTYSEFVLNGEMNPDFTYDGIHLSAMGQRLLGKILLRYI